jgi:hypothetical protein
VYILVEIPLIKPFSEMSTRELRAFFDWFVSQVPERIEALKCAIGEIGAADDVVLDGTRESIAGIGEWMAKNMQAYKIPVAAEEIPSRLKFGLGLDTYRLDSLSFSLAFDIGMYVSHVMMSRYRQLYWEQDVKRKKYADYGYPVISGFGKVSFNPTTMMHTHAIGLIDGSRSGKGLLKIYDVWVAYINS